MLRLATLVASSLLAIPLIAWLAVVADERDAGRGDQTAATLSAGVAIVGLFVVGSVLVLARPVAATALFLLAAALALLVGYDDGREGLAVYGVFGLLLAAMSFACSRRSVPPWFGDGAED